MESDLPFVSVCIPVYNDTARLKMLLELLEAQTYPSDRFEVIVCDNASTQPVEPALVNAPHARIVRETRVGPDHARNAGILASKAQYLAFTDSDTTPYPNWLENGVRALLRHPNCGLVGGPVHLYPVDPNRTTLTEKLEMTTAFNTKANVLQHHFMPTCNLFTHRAVLDKVGLFDGDLLGSSGDEEWGQRVHAAGYELIYDPEVALRHPARHSFAELKRKTRRIAFGYVGLLKHRSPKPLLLQWPYLRRLWLLPMPVDVRTAFRNNKYALSDQFKLFGILYWGRVYRAWVLVTALFPTKGRLW